METLTWNMLFAMVICSSLWNFAVAEWNDWSTWSACSASCGNGVRTRQRTCMGGVCEGAEEMISTCVLSDCDTEVVQKWWSDWGQWSVCTRTCGGGMRTRTRSCSTGNSTDCCEYTDEESCLLEHTQTRECINDDCLGTWSDWRMWGTCSARCGEGVQSRLRECEPTGSNCIGGKEQSRMCYIQCPPSVKFISDMDEAKSCDNNNPCKNDGICATNGDHVTCICRGNWRGRNCNDMCLYDNDEMACANKRGIFYDCANCNRFIVCSRNRDAPISMSCTTDRMWDGNGCRLANETRILCLENSYP
ncbi:A disintegrin and metalloproteinase with thrombospondin motifs adt-2-like [Ruditapes philippinarum]|uniref:A disintegrin and metalloproteinase with thrombospondin motifs adt-2-like n=1 Tax=Ruditapes philippinarum TaxID=129788 RepID=UPI00295A7C9A|nr:A disintegrin and metalloproteinase with thrombospondin motifs adt-2-like [Ruditapes philippinarum]